MPPLKRFASTGCTTAKTLGGKGTPCGQPGAEEYGQRAQPVSRAWKSPWCAPLAVRWSEYGRACARNSGVAAECYVAYSPGASSALAKIGRASCRERV